MRVCAAAVVTMLLAASACAPYAHRGQNLYSEGRYIEAAEVFELTEARLGGETDPTCASYGLYRGLNFMELGDLKSARYWLAYATTVERKAPGSLSGEDSRRLSRAFKAVEERLRSPAAVPGHESRVASTEKAAAAPRGAGPAPNGRRSLVAE